jgi:signal transduction histidine kinase
MPDGGDLDIRVADSGADVRVEISDSGVGIPVEIRDRVFDPWFTTKAPGRGTGLGLSITRGVVTEHGGRIAVASAPGRGTTVTVMLPAQPPAGEVDSSHA